MRRKSGQISGKMRHGADHADPNQPPPRLAAAMGDGADDDLRITEWNSFR